MRRLAALLLLAFLAPARAGDDFRPPAVPLVVQDPYVSAWSFSDRLTDDWPRHWTGKVMALCGMARIDEKAWRWCGPQPAGVPDVPAMEQKSLRVGALSTEYVFEAGGIELRVTFISPALPWDLDEVSLPLTYVMWQLRSTDDAPHLVALYLDASAEWVVNTVDQDVEWGRVRLGTVQAVWMGSADQRVLHRSGDDVRLDWGHLYLAQQDWPSQLDVLPGRDNWKPRAMFAVGADAHVRGEFVDTAMAPQFDDLRQPRAANDAWPVIAVSTPAVAVKPVHGDVASVRVGPLRIACDEVRNIQLMEQPLRPWWQRRGVDIGAVLGTDPLLAQAQCEAVADFERDLHSDLVAVGGEHYAQVCELAFRQVLGAHGLAIDGRGRAAHFPKECFSNGCISTVDVIYPAAPFFLVFNPGLLEAQLRPVLDYAASGRWPHPFAPHDLGTYPLANGQVYGGGERTEEDQMPVEECGNMLLLAGALQHLCGRDALAREYASQLDGWAAYLEQRGFDPENQLCTDDFAGHLAHNVNLSLKAILALGAWGQACAAIGRADEATRFSAAARDFAAKWQSAAGPPPTPLAFDQPGTWSQKYNLVWDDLLDLHLFPPALAAAELAQYRAQSGPFGPPLDSRRGYTKLDWSTWTAAFAPDRDSFAAAFEPLWRFVSATPQRVPLTDWYETADAKKVGFQARSVVGGLFIRLLQDRERAAAWRARGK
ncbi:MAG TPA: DUF4965 domain-containing protein [Planctomycetota bacterium]|nr:DUF4965 domain-containing protein [Planctomycetota bacterium]